MQKQHQEAIVCKILSVAHELNRIGEQVAAAFVLNNITTYRQATPSLKPGNGSNRAGNG
jgi:hypothetical protein